MKGWANTQYSESRNVFFSREEVLIQRRDAEPHLTSGVWKNVLAMGTREGVLASNE